MLLFWIAAALLSAAAVAVVLARAAKPAEPQAEAPELVVYRRHLAELDETRAQGLLDDAGYGAARAEAARRLLSASDRAKAGGAAEETAGDRKREGRLALAVAVGAVALAMGAYLLVGSPGRPDQPYAARLKTWISADPANLGPGELAARLKYVTSRRPGDSRAWFFLGYAYEASGDPTDAAEAYEKSLALNARQADAWAGLGESLTAMNEGQVNAGARNAFERALALDPGSPASQVFLGQADIQAGDVDKGLARWRTLAATFKTGDPRRVELERKIAEVSRPSAKVAPDQAPMIRAMVERQAAALKANPNDVDGWVRLVRSYAVLHDAKAEGDALKRARAIFKDRPADLARIERAPGG